MIRSAYYRLCGAPHKRYAALPGGVLRGFDFCPPLLPRMLTKPRTVCFCQPVASMISARVAPLARFIIAITSAFLFVRDSFAPFCARARRGALAGDFFAFPLAGATSAACGATSGERRGPPAKCGRRLLCGW